MINYMVIMVNMVMIWYGMGIKGMNGKEKEKICCANLNNGRVMMMITIMVRFTISFRPAIIYNIQPLYEPQYDSDALT